MKIKNIVFDLGGVVLTDEDVGFSFKNEMIMNKLRVKEEQLRDVWRKNWKLVGEDKISIREFYDKLQKELVGKSNENLTEKLLRVYEEKTHPLELYYLLPKLKENYKLFALTNMTKFGFEFKTQKYNLKEVFDLVISSSEVHLSKPDPRIFEILIQETNLKPQESLYIDDAEKNIKIGKKLGFETHLFTGFKNLIKTFRECKINYE